MYSIADSAILGRRCACEIPGREAHPRPNSHGRPPSGVHQADPAVPEPVQVWRPAWRPDAVCKRQPASVLGSGEGIRPRSRQTTMQCSCSTGCAGLEPFSSHAFKINPNMLKPCLQTQAMHPFEHARKHVPLRSFRLRTHTILLHLYRPTCYHRIITVYLLHMHACMHSSKQIAHRYGS